MQHETASTEGSVIYCPGDCVPEGLQEVVVDDEEGAFVYVVEHSGSERQLHGLVGAGDLGEKHVTARLSLVSRTKKHIDITLTFEHIF